MFCTTEVFTILEDSLPGNTNASNPWLYDAMNQFVFDYDGLAKNQFLEVFSSGKLCTDCVSGLLNTAKAMGYLAPVEREDLVFKGAQSRCGKSFGCTWSRGDLTRADVQ